MLFWIVAIALGVILGFFTLSLLANDDRGCGCWIVVILIVIAIGYIAC